jgi:hypothetical protein
MPTPRPRLHLWSILRARCPACRTGRVLDGPFRLHRACGHCGYDFHPESGFYLGAMMVGFLLNAMLTIPPMVALKLAGAEVVAILVFPFVEFAIVGTAILFYARIVWLHLEHKVSSGLNN